MDLFQNASDDQIALAGCLAALLFSGGLMYLSFFVGRLRQQPSESQSIRLETRRPGVAPAQAADRNAA